MTRVFAWNNAHSSNFKMSNTLIMDYELKCIIMYSAHCFFISHLFRNNRTELNAVVLATFTIGLFRKKRHDQPIMIFFWTFHTFLRSYFSTTKLNLPRSFVLKKTIGLGAWWKSVIIIMLKSEFYELTTLKVSNCDWPWLVIIIFFIFVT